MVSMLQPIIAAMILLASTMSLTAFAQPAAPVEIAQAYVATANTGDFDQTWAFYADDAVVRNPLGLFMGKDQIGSWLRQDVQTTRATSREWRVEGNAVINTGVVSLARFKAIGIDPVEYRSEYVIEGGKIRFFSPTVLLTPEQQQLAQAKMPPAPAPSGDPVAVVKQYIATANTGDFEATLAFYAEDAVVKNPLGLFAGKPAIGQWLQADVRTTRATPGDFQVTNGGTTVINTGTVSLARFKALGIEEVAYRSDYLIEGDKIKYFAPSVVLTPEQQQRVRAAAPVAAPLPATGATSRLDLAALCAAALALSLGLMMRRRLHHAMSQKDA